MKLYCFDISGFYTTELEITDIYAPQPAGTTIKPPDQPEGKVAVFSSGSWSLVDKPLAAMPVLTLEDFDKALTNHLDSTAQERKYDNRITCALRAGYVGPFQAEGKAFASWMDSCNYTAYQLLSEVEQGIRPLPVSTKELIDALPIMVWPV